MLILLIILISLMSAIYGYKSTKTIFNPLTVFCTLWAIITLMASLRLFGINQVSDKTYIIILLGIISFIFGSTIFGKFQFKINTTSKNNQLIFNMKISYILIVVAISILSITAINSLNILLKGHDLSYIRYMANKEVVTSDTGILDILFNYVAQPICNLLIPVSIYNFISKKKNKILIIGTIISIALLIISNGGRFILLYFIIHFIFISIFMNGLHVKKNLKYIILVVIISVSVLSFLTISRGSSIPQTLYIYFCGCMPHLDIQIANFDSFGSYTYGFSSFQGFIRPFFALIKKIGLIYDFPTVLQQAQFLSLQVEQAVSIGSNLRFNGFVSLFYSFYIDFNLPGVIFLSMLYGYICKIVFNNLQKNFSSMNIIIYSLLLQSMITSMVRFQFTTFIFALSFIYLLLIKPQYVKEKKQVLERLKSNSGV